MRPQDNCLIPTSTVSGSRDKSDAKPVARPWTRLMDALILAAGYGSRMQEISHCKPLTRVCGVTLVERAVQSLAAAGVDRAVVVTGYQAAEVEAELHGIASRTGLIVEPHRIDCFDRPNGHSVMAGASAIAGEYLLTMADHVLSPVILRDLIANAAADRGVTLAIDCRRDGKWIDPDDATWVLRDSRNFISRIGKHVERVDAVDCGAFLATPELANAIADAIADGKPGSLSDGVQRLATGGRAATMDIGEEWWIDVDDARALALAEAMFAVQIKSLEGTAIG